MDYEAFEDGTFAYFAYISLILMPNRSNISFRLILYCSVHVPELFTSSTTGCHPYSPEFPTDLTLIS